MKSVLNDKKPAFWIIVMAVLACVVTAVCFLTDPVAEAELDGIESVTKWFDGLNGDEAVWGTVREIRLDEFPHVTFQWHPEGIEAVTDTSVITLYNGMPIWSVYFCDLTGDGKRELCSSVRFGQGMAVDNRVMIYDYANGVSYSMGDSGVTDYILRQNESDGNLYVDKKAHMGGELLSTGRLVFEDDCLQVLWPEKPSDGHYIIRVRKSAFFIA